MVLSRSSMHDDKTVGSIGAYRRIEPCCSYSNGAPNTPWLEKREVLASKIKISEVAEDSEITHLSLYQRPCEHMAASLSLAVCALVEVSGLKRQRGRERKPWFG